jgi:hypothetical protein
MYGISSACLRAAPQKGRSYTLTSDISLTVPLSRENLRVQYACRLWDNEAAGSFDSIGCIS